MKKFSTFEIILLIITITISMALVVGLVAMIFVPTNEYNKEIRMKLVDLVCVLGGGVMTIVASRLSRMDDDDFGTKNDTKD